MYFFASHDIKMPDLVVTAAFFSILTNPYELAYESFVNEGSPWPDNLAELQRIGVDTDAFFLDIGGIDVIQSNRSTRTSSTPPTHIQFVRYTCV